MAELRSALRYSFASFCVACVAVLTACDGARSGLDTLRNVDDGDGPDASLGGAIGAGGSTSRAGATGASRASGGTSSSAGGSFATGGATSVGVADAESTRSEDAALDAVSEPSPVVRGRVLEGRVPFPGLTVRSGTSTAVTGLDGSFELDGIGASYDVMVAVPVGESVDKFIFEGLSRRDPTLSVEQLSPDRSNAVVGWLKGVPLPTPSNSAGSVSLSTATARFGQGISAGNAGTFSFDDGFWNGDSSSNATLRALLWNTDSSGAPTSFLGYGATLLVVTLDAGSCQNGCSAPLPWSPTVTLAPVAARDCTVTANSVTGMSDAVYLVQLNFAGEASWPLFGSNGPASLPTSIPVPEIPGASATVQVSVSDPEPEHRSFSTRVQALPASGGPVFVELPDRVTPLTPAPYSSSALDTEFSWTKSDLGLYELSLTVFDRNGVASVVSIVTARSALHLPDGALTSENAKRPVLWQVEAFGPATSVDDVCGVQPSVLSNSLFAFSVGDYAVSCSALTNWTPISPEGGP